MRLLLDTHILLWWLSDDPALPTAAKAAMASPASEIFVSAATAWEIAIKQALGRLEFPTAHLPTILAESGFSPLAVALEHAVAAGALPRHHDDPFDRMLVAQAVREGLTLVSVDAMVRLYDVTVLDLTE